MQSQTREKRQYRSPARGDADGGHQTMRIDRNIFHGVCEIQATHPREKDYISQMAEPPPVGQVLLQQLRHRNTHKKAEGEKWTWEAE